MFIFLIWLELICCGVVNGYIYDHVQAPWSYCIMVIPIIIAVILLFLHRVYTQLWYGGIFGGNGYHSSVFRTSAVILFVVTLYSLFAVHTGDVSSGFLAGCLTVMIAFSIAAIKERSYV